MSQLARTAIGDFRIEEAVDPELLTADRWADYLLPPLRAVETLPRMELTEEELARIRSGQTIPRPATLEAEGEIAGARRRCAVWSRFSFLGGATCWDRR